MRPASADQRARAPAAGGREHRLRDQAGRQVGVAVDPPGRGAGPDRSLGVRQDDAAADAQPPHRADPERRPRGPHQARRGGHPRAPRHEPALARGDGLPAAQPVPDVDLRQRRLRAARTVAPAPPPQGARAAGDRRPAPRRPLRRGPGRPRPPRPAPLRGPAAAPVHRARDRPPPGGAADGRAVRGAGPDFDEHDRAADRRAAPRAGGRGGHPQPRPGAADRRQGRVHVPRRPGRVRGDRGSLRERPVPPAPANTSRAPSARRRTWRT